MDQAHEQIADSGTVQRLIEEGVLAVQDGFLKGTLHDVVCRAARRLGAGKASASTSDSVNRRWLCPSRSSVPSCAPPTALPSIHAALSSTARCAPDGNAASRPAIVSVPVPVSRRDKRRPASPAHYGILRESSPPI